MAILQLVPGLVTLRFSGLNDQPVSFGGFMAAMSALGGVASYIGGKWSDSNAGNREKPLGVSCAGAVRNAPASELSLMIIRVCRSLALWR
jgi:hypothetical protein